MNNLTKKIKNYIRLHGPITFERFMDFALYDREYGYYTSNESKIGKTGDFYTSPSVHSSFGAIISNFISKAYNLLEKDHLTVIELGSGDGYLALDILNSIKKNNIKLYDFLTYFCIEVSDKKINKSKNVLKNHLQRVKWENSIENIKEKPRAVIVSNEFFDSLPFHRIKFIDDKPKEIFVELENNIFSEIENDIVEPDIKRYIESTGLQFHNEQQIEVNTNYSKVIDNICRILDTGFILTFDYGYLNRELLSPKRAKGTYRCFYKHQLTDEPYKNIGEQDITSSVDFSSIIDIGNKQGLELIKYTTQGQFLADWGILELIEQSTEQERIIIKNLLLPNLMGMLGC